MSDKRFQDRLKRISRSHRGGAKADIIAGVGTLDEARQTAARAPSPVLTLMLSAAAGYAAAFFVQTRLGFDGVLALTQTPQDVVPMALSDMTLGGAGVGLALIVLCFVYAVLAGGKKRRLHAFGFAGMAGVMTAIALQIADMERLTDLTGPVRALIGPAG